MFNAVGDEGYSISDIKPVYDYDDYDESEKWGGGSITIMTLRDDKTTAETFWWLSDEGCGVADGLGWYPNNVGTGKRANKVFDPGEGFLFGSALGQIPVTYAGEVKYPVQLTMRKGISICGNFWPTKMSISEIKPVYDYDDYDESEKWGGGSITIMTLKDDKTTAETFWWLSDEGCGVADGLGWYPNNVGTGKRADKEFEAAEGFIFGTALGAIDVSFPELKLN